VELNVNTYLRRLVDEDASDLHFKVGTPPVLRINGQLVLIEGKRLSPSEVEQISMSLLPESKKALLEKGIELDVAYSVPGLGRFRTNIYKQRGSFAVAIRYIPSSMELTFEGLNLPPVIRDLSEQPRGLILVTGTTGSGKSTTLAAMIQHINTARRCHIVTIEDPIEFLHRDNKSIISQREIGEDTTGFSTALKYVVRQDPDVILVGEMRDVETVESVIQAATTGHLVFSTLHTTDAVQTINRIVNFFPSHQHQQIRVDLSACLKGILGLRLLPRADGTGRVPAVEVMVSTPTIRELLLDEQKMDKIKEAMEQGSVHYGMQTYDQALIQLYKDGFIHYEEALNHATSPGDLALRIRSEMPDMRKQ